MAATIVHFVCLVCLLLGGAATLAVAAQEKTKFTKLLATGVQIGHLREYVAKGIGVYEEAGLEVTLNRPVLSGAIVVFVQADTF